MKTDDLARGLSSFFHGNLIYGESDTFSGIDFLSLSTGPMPVIDLPRLNQWMGRVRGNEGEVVQAVGTFISLMLHYSQLTGGLEDEKVSTGVAELAMSNMQLTCPSLHLLIVEGLQYLHLEENPA